MNKNLQKIINKTVELYEKAEYNIKNADKLTLWVVIVLLTLSILTNKTTPVPKVTVNVTIPELPIAKTKTTNNDTITDKARLNFDTSDVMNMDAVIFGNGAIKQAADKETNTMKTSVQADTRFKYCLYHEGVQPDDPFSPKREDSYIFVLDEKMNPSGEIYLKLTHNSNYSPEDVITKSAWWYDSFKKVPCTPEIIKTYRK